MTRLSKKVSQPLFGKFPFLPFAHAGCCLWSFRFTLGDLAFLRGVGDLFCLGPWITLRPCPVLIDLLLPIYSGPGSVGLGYLTSAFRGLPAGQAESVLQAGSAQRSVGETQCQLRSPSSRYMAYGGEEGQLGTGGRLHPPDDAPKSACDRPPTSRLPEFEPGSSRLQLPPPSSAVLTPSIRVHRWIRT